MDIGTQHPLRETLAVVAPPLPPPAKPPSSLGLLSCLACLYVAGRLRQDFESRILLSVLHCNSDQRPKVLMVEDKLMNLGCKEIVEAEIDLLLALSENGWSRSNLGFLIAAISGRANMINPPLWLHSKNPYYLGGHKGK